MPPRSARYRDLLTAYLLPQWPKALALALVLFGSVGLRLINPQILRAYIDSAHAGSPVRTMFVAAALFLGVVVLTMILSIWAAYASEDVGWTATNALRADLALHCLTLDMSFHNARTPGELIERIDGDVTALANFFSQFIIQVLGNLVLLVGVLVLLAREDWRLGAAFVAFVLLSMAVLNRVRAVAVPYWQLARQASADFFGFLEERLAGSVDIRSSAATPYVLRRFYELIRQRLHQERKAGVMGAIMGSVMFGMFTLSYVIAFTLGGSLYRSGVLTVGSVYLILQYIGMLEQPIRQLIIQLEDLQKAVASIRRIGDLYRVRPSIADADGPAALLPAGALEVRFEDVWFTYGQSAGTLAPAAVPSGSSMDGPGATDWVLRRMSFVLAPGRVLGVLGRTGSGKSTIARLLTRLYDPNEGAVLIGGVDLRALRLDLLRDSITMVTQDIQLFQGALRDNLTLFDNAISDTRIVAVLEDLGLGGWYRGLSAGLDTELPAGGGGLSAGQAQLVAFTRVFLRDPRVVILDEASSCLDPATERLVERAVDKLLNGRTAITIAHRLATMERADEIMILEDGLIVEYGPRTDLARDPCSRFAHLLSTGLSEALA